MPLVHAVYLLKLRFSDKTIYPYFQLDIQQSIGYVTVFIINSYLILKQKNNHVRGPVFTSTWTLFPMTH